MSPVDKPTGIHTTGMKQNPISHPPTACSFDLFGDAAFAFPDRQDAQWRAESDHAESDYYRGGALAFVIKGKGALTLYGVTQSNENCNNQKRP